MEAGPLSPPTIRKPEGNPSEACQGRSGYINKTTYEEETRDTLSK